MARASPSAKTRLAVLSPKLYREFALPYVNEVSEEFGGVFIHSCGNILHQLDNLAQVHNLRGLNFGVSETPSRPSGSDSVARQPSCPTSASTRTSPSKATSNSSSTSLRAATHWRGLCLVVAPPALAAPKEGASHQAGMGPQISTQNSSASSCRQPKRHCNDISAVGRRPPPPTFGLRSPVWQPPCPRPPIRVQKYPYRVRRSPLIVRRENGTAWPRTKGWAVSDHE